MTDNQEKELFRILEMLVSGVQRIEKVQDEHSRILNDHSRILTRLDAKTDSVAEKVIDHEVRLTKLEKDSDDLSGGVH